MDSHNLSVVLGPTILRPQMEELEEMLKDSPAVLDVVREMIDNYSLLFPELQTQPPRASSKKNPIPQFPDLTDYKAKYQELVSEKAIWEIYKSQMEIRVQRLERTEEDMSYQLYNWMCLAVRLDSLSRGKIQVFDKESLFEELMKEKVAYSEWPKRIVQAVDQYSKN